MYLQERKHERLILCSFCTFVARNRLLASDTIIAQSIFVVYFSVQTIIDIEVITSGEGFNYSNLNNTKSLNFYV